MNEVNSVVLLVLLGLFTLPVDGAAQWQRTRFGMLELSEHIRDIVFTSPEDCFFVLEKGIGRSLSRGRFTKRTWLELTWSDSSLRAVVFPTKNVGYAVGSRVWRTTDAGDTWSPTISQPPCADLDAYSVKVTESTRIVVAGADCNVFYSDDDGSRWLAGQTDAVTGLLIPRAIASGPMGLLWVGTWNSGIFGNVSFMFKSTNNGENWTRLFNWDEWDITAMFRPNKILYGLGRGLWVVGERRSAIVRRMSPVFRSSDLGQTWDTVSGPFQYDVRAMAFANERVGYIGDVAGNIYSTTDGGDTWQNDSVPSGGRAINAIAFTGGGEIYAVGDNGLILRRDVPTSVREQDTKPALRLYPNPTTGVFTVESSSGPAELYVVDVLGSIVLQTTVDARSTLDLSAQPPAMYRVLMRTSQGVVAQTVAVVR